MSDCLDLLLSDTRHGKRFVFRFKAAIGAVSQSCGLRKNVVCFGKREGDIAAVLYLYPFRFI